MMPEAELMTDSLSLSRSLSLRVPLSEPVSSSGSTLSRFAEEERFLEPKRKGDKLRPDLPNALSRLDFFCERSSSSLEVRSDLPVRLRRESVSAPSPILSGAMPNPLREAEWGAPTAIMDAKAEESVWLALSLSFSPEESESDGVRTIRVQEQRRIKSSGDQGGVAILAVALNGHSTRG